MFFCGDSHGAIPERVLQREGTVVHVGDVGIGFPESWGNYMDRGTPLNKIAFIRGNHDNPEECRAHPNYLGEYGYWEEHGFFFVSGGWSIDQDVRIIGRDWWPDEELSYVQQCRALDLYKEKKPLTVVSHSCPASVVRPLFGLESIKNSTDVFLDELFKIHRPKLWIFGHFHESKQQNILGTEFICLAENEVRDIHIVR